jgi:hypothetical protein
LIYSQIWLNLSRDHHEFYLHLFLWTDDHHFGSKWKFLKKRQTASHKPKNWRFRCH